MAAPASDESLDSIGTSGVRVLQRKTGYRFTLDAVLLAAFAGQEHRGDGHWLELGAGSGVVSLLLVRQFGVPGVDALELQTAVHARLVQNIALNGCEGRVRPLLGDLREPSRSWEPGRYHHVVANPPYRPVGAGVRSPDEERALSKEELACDAEALARAARHALAPGGAASIIYPAARMAEVLRVLGAARLWPRVLRLVHARAGTGANHFLVKAVRDENGPLEVRPPLVVHGAGPGGYGPEVAALMDAPRAAER